MIDPLLERIAAATDTPPPTDPPPDDADRAARVAAFLEEYPEAVALDPAWHEFLTRHGGGTFSSGESELAMLGLDERLGPHLLFEEGDVISEDGFLDFAVLSVRFEGRPPAETYRDIGFTFAAGGAHRAGVYARPGDGKERWFAPDFTAWLAIAADHAGDWPGWAGRILAGTDDAEGQ